MKTIHSLAQYWTPDQIAECIIPMRNPLYSVLWELTANYKMIDVENCGPSDCVGINAMATFWDLLSDEQQNELNELLAAFEGAA